MIHFSAMTTISTSAGSASMASIGLGTSSALTTTSQAISTTPLATSTVIPTPGEIQCFTLLSELFTYI